MTKTRSELERAVAAFEALATSGLWGYIGPRPESVRLQMGPSWVGRLKIYRGDARAVLSRDGERLRGMNFDGVWLEPGSPRGDAIAEALVRWRDGIVFTTEDLLMTAPDSPDWRLDHVIPEDFYA